MSKNLVGSSDINIVTNGDNISLELAQSYYNKKQVDNELKKKVNTQDGKDLSSNDFTDTLKTKLNGIETGAEVNKIAVIKVDGTALTTSSKAVNIDLSGKQNKLTAGSNIQISGSTISATDTKYSKATSSADGLMSSTDKVKIDTVEENAQENKIESISVNGLEQAITDKKVNIMVENTTIYGIKRSLTSTSSKWERTDNSVGLVAKATHDGSAVQNDFDSIYPWSDIYTYNYDRSTGLETAKIGNANFKFDGTNGEVLTKIPEFYYRRWRDEENEYMQISKYPIDGFTKAKEFSVGRYDSTVISGAIHSYSGYTPEVNRNITSFRNLSKAVGTNFGQLDWRYFLIQMLFLVEYADYNSQSVLGNGATGFRVNDSDKALIAETGVNRILLETSRANSFDIGQQVSIGTSSAWNWSVAQNRTITKKESYSDGNISGTMVYFNGSPVNIAVGNCLWTTGQVSGICDVLGMKSGCLKTPKNSCIYRGIENVFGNVYQFLDGINIKDYVAYICYDPTEYAVDKFTDKYAPVGYTNANVSNVWAKKLGYDENNPLVGLTTETGGSDSTNMCDYYYCNSGNRIVLVGGCFSSAASAGLWFFNCSGTSSDAYFNFGSRLLRY